MPDYEDIRGTDLTPLQPRHRACCRPDPSPFGPDSAVVGGVVFGYFPHDLGPIARRSLQPLAQAGAAAGAKSEIALVGYC